MIKGLYAIVDTSTPLSLTALALDYLKGGAKIIQLRMKGILREKVAYQAREILKLKSEYPFLFILNDDPMLAKHVQADGVHLGQEDCPVTKAREIVGSSLIIGKSTHSLEQALLADQEPVDYIACGAIFPTTTKALGHPILGAKKLKEIVSRVTKPIVAIGGINRENAQEVVDTGVDSIALISALYQAEDREKETKFYSNLWV